MTGARNARGAEGGFQSVVLDCDSTLVKLEGIDELAAERISDVRALTDAAMRGEIPLEAVYGRRLEIIRPTRDQVDRLGALYVENLVEDARQTVAALLWLGKDVRIISGGLRPSVEMVAREIGIASEAVAAVGIEFDEAGEYVGFDRASPLARSSGKPDLIRDWHLPRPSLLVGDGATDLEASHEVDFFVAYMGVAYRENVAAGADRVLTSTTLAPLLALAATAADRVRLVRSRWGEILRRGDEILEG